jgi:hypothetical protein
MREFASNQFHFRQTVITAFTDGDCWRLAQYLSDRTGWDMVALGIKLDRREPEGQRYWEHMAVRRPDGRIVDVLGIHTEAEFLELWARSHDGADVFVANHPGYIAEEEPQFRHSPKTYGDEILEALGEA